MAASSTRLEFMREKTRAEGGRSTWAHGPTLRPARLRCSHTHRSHSDSHGQPSAAREQISNRACDSGTKTSSALDSERHCFHIVGAASHLYEVGRGPACGLE